MASHPNLFSPSAAGGAAAEPDLPTTYEGVGGGSAAKRKAHKRLQRQALGGDAAGKGGGAVKDKAGEMTTSLVVGVVNVVVGVPALISYTAIIFQVCARRVRTNHPYTAAKCFRVLISSACAAGSLRASRAASETCPSCPFLFPTPFTGAPV